LIKNSNGFSKRGNCENRSSSRLVFRKADFLILLQIFICHMISKVCDGWRDNINIEILIFHVIFICFSTLYYTVGIQTLNSFKYRVFLTCNSGYGFEGHFLFLPLNPKIKYNTYIYIYVLSLSQKYQNSKIDNYYNGF